MSDQMTNIENLLLQRGPIGSLSRETEVLLAFAVGTQSDEEIVDIFRTVTTEIAVRMTGNPEASLEIMNHACKRVLKLAIKSLDRPPE